MSGVPAAVTSRILFSSSSDSRDTSLKLLLLAGGASTLLLLLAGARLIFGIPLLDFAVFLTEVLATPLFYVGTTSSPGSLKLPVPNVPAAEGDRLVFQGAYAGTRGLELINVRHTYLRK